jgi:biopolymer transport protein ExbD
VSGKVQDEAALRATFADARAHSPDTLVLFQADAGVPHGQVVRVMEQAREAGLTRLAIATRAGEDGQ